MYKLITKIAAFSLVLTGTFFLLSGGKIFAVTCPGPAGVPAEWGINTGVVDHGFASLTVHAVNGGDLDASGNPKALNVKYNLNSKLPSLPAGKTYGPKPPGLSSSLWPDARIFKVHVDASGDIKTDARYKQRWFGTGGLVDKLYPGGNSCGGWDQLGPGDSAKQGNLYVLDCQEVDNGGGKHDTRFWISNITTPSGAAGMYGGHWEVKFSVDGGGSSTITNNITTNPMDPNVSFPNKLYFSVWNGVNARLDLVWHPDSPTGGPISSICNTVSVTTGSGQRAYVNVKDSSGYALIHGPGGDDDWVVVGQSLTQTWNNLKPRGMQSTVHIIKKSKDASGNFTVVDNDALNTYTCYDASCDLSVQGNVAGKDHGVESGPGSDSSWSITAHIHNNAGDPGNPHHEATELYGALESDGSKPLILASTSSSPPGGFWFAPGQVGTRGNAQNTWYFGDPGGAINNYGISAKLYYDLNSNSTLDSGDFVVATCSPDSYDLYKQFDLNVSASIDMSPSVEDPTSVIFKGYANGTVPDYGGGIDVNYDVNSERTPYGGATQSLDSRTNSTGHTALVYNYSYTPPSNAAGDKYFFDNLFGDPNCQFYVHQAHGWIGPGNQFSDDTSGECGSAGPQYVYDRPYLHTYGADVVSGSNFKSGDTCDTTGNSQNISAFRSTEASKGGSGTQFAALALAQISGFGSASTTSAGPTGLSFANDGNPQGSVGGGGSDQPNDGGGYAGQAICTRDFYNTQQTPNSYTSTSVNISTSGQIQDGKQTAYNISGSNLTVTANASDFDKQAFIYVDGNVIIKNNIQFQPGKYLAIIAKGDIYIDKSVTRLDGLYVAQPRDSSNGGTIYTCADTSSVTPQDVALDSRYTQCSSQLVINGAFAAKYVKFHRVANSLRDSVNKETPGNFSDGSGTKAAEIFNFSPEIYLYTPIFEDVTTGQAYQYITTLPPVL